ncbi:MAG: aldehyde-activating protein, partial [Candidatus Pelagibacter sp.]|nr:aldehyde-activating protein [Candidatus Pelagibacter sp.]
MKKKSSCHCGSVQLILTMPNGLEKIRRCNCSICSRKNAVVASVKI